MKFMKYMLDGVFTPQSESARARLPSLWLFLLQLTVAVTLAARGWLMYRWDSHLRGLLWNEGAMRPFVEEYLLMDWQQYANESDPYITLGIEILGGVLMVGGLLTLLMHVRPLSFLKWLLLPLWMILALDSYSNYFDVSYQEGMLIEYALQASTPLLLLWVLVLPNRMRVWAWGASVLVAMCFIGHGMYAMGYHPVPWSFQVMTMDILGVDETMAKRILYVAGILDFAVAIGILIPVARRVSLIYMIFWGGVTALARIWAHFDKATKYWGIDPWLAETLVRTVHWMIPVLLLMLLRSRSPNSRLTLAMLEVSSQTKRILSRAKILHK